MGFSSRWGIIWQPFQLLDLVVSILILGHPFPTQSFKDAFLSLALAPPPEMFMCFSKTEYQPSAGGRLTQPDQNALNFENDSPLGIEPSDKSKAVVILKTELYTWQSLSN